MGKIKISEAVLNRKGARKVQDIPANVLELQNFGEVPTVNLTEWLAIDQVQLINKTFPGLGLEGSVDVIVKILEQQKKPSTMSSIKLIGQHLYENCRLSNSLAATIKLLSNHKSDTIRCYAAYLIALNEDLNIVEKLNQSRALIADTHFGVREIVWMALRPEIEKEITDSIEVLSKWTTDSDENIRRFTTESTRPRGVWCKHLEYLKEQPEKALTILESLKSDKSKYVQDSVGNWLNDASKSNPQFVLKLCRKWTSNSKTAETKKIVKRALRTIEKIKSD